MEMVEKFLSFLFLLTSVFLPNNFNDLQISPSVFEAVFLTEEGGIRSRKANNFDRFLKVTFM